MASKISKISFCRGITLCVLLVLVFYATWSCSSNTVPAPSDDESCCNDLNFIIVDESKAKCQFDINDSIWEYMYISSTGELSIIQCHFSEDQLNIKNFHSVNLDKISCDSLKNNNLTYIGENDYTFETLVCLDTMSFVQDFIGYSKKNTDGTYGKWHRSKEQEFSSFTESCIRSKGESRKVNELFGNTPKNVVIDF